ncbi:zeatin O-xylosyltransferase-like [Coffea arabica]|uniref:Glycosyltransferase n=1 Tax=Coffea arabica TaxID=13443 RepID=A0A6P6SWN0_COFAR|nr:zeatin O-xylosyltransferase-like [Coffea arabica]
MAKLEVPGAKAGYDEKTDVVVVMVPLPAQGHLNQLLHLSRLISSYNIPVHFVGSATHNRQAKDRVHGWDPLAISDIRFHEFPLPSFPTPPPDPKAPTKLPTQLVPAFFATLHLCEPVCELVTKLSSTARRVVVIHDSLMCYVVQDMPSIPNAESYCFQSVSAFALYSYVWEAMGKPVLADGEPVNDLLSTPASGFPEEFSEFFKVQQEARKCNWGNLYNSSRLIDGEYLNLLAEIKFGETENNWAIGPFNPLVITEDQKSKKSHKCLEWLDKQAPKSVIFVSFGSTTSLSDEEVEQIAIGLERSGQKFMWVLRDADTGDVSIGEGRKAQLPEGYEERVDGRGFILREWAPQLEILGHPSTGGFMSHCGWNSCVESISMGVPMAAWPMHSDQPRNAILVTKILKTGLMVGDLAHQDESFKAEVVEDAVKRLMNSTEGQEMRKRAEELSDALKQSVIKGSDNSTEMDTFIAHITR